MFRRSLLTLIFVLSAFLISSYSVQAQSDWRGGERVELRDTEVVDGDYFAAGEAVVLSGTVNGDAYLAGGKVTVDGTVNGDLLVAGGTLELRGRVTGDIRAAGGDIDVRSDIGRNLTVAGGQIDIGDTARLGGSLVAGAGDLSVAAPVARHITAGVGTFNLASPVGGDVNYWSESDLVLSREATVAGTLTRRDVPGEAKKQSRAETGAAVGVFAAFKLTELFTLFLLGSLLIRLAPVFSRGVITNLQQNPWRSLFAGFAAVILIPVTAMLLFFTVIGIPLAILLFLAFILLCFFVKIFAAYYVGTAVLGYFRRQANPYLTLFLGFLLYYALFLIPVLGWLAAAVIYLMAFGSFLLHKRDVYLAIRAKKLI